MSDISFKADVIIVGAGLSGMVAAHEAIERQGFAAGTRSAAKFGGPSVLVLGRLVHGRYARTAPFGHS